MYKIGEAYETNQSKYDIFILLLNNANIFSQTDDPTGTVH